MWSLWACVVLIMSVGDPPADLRSVRKPGPLLSCLQARKDIVTADIEWSLTFNTAEPAELRYRSRISPAGSILVHRPDERGVVRYDEHGNAAILGALNLLDDHLGTWEYQPGRMTATLWPDHFPREIDVRCAGLLPLYSSSTRLADALWSYPDEKLARRYTQRKAEGGMVEVVARIDDSREIVWRLDPKKGWNPTRVSEVYQGRTVLRSESRLRLYGKDIWFPELVEYYVPKRDRPITIIKIHEARFNAPDLPRKFTPAEIGVEPGLSIEVQVHGPGASRCWDGDQLTSFQEFKQEILAGRKSYGPTVTQIREVLRAVKRGEASVDFHTPVVDIEDNPADPGRKPMSTTQPAFLERTENEWERYVRAFIASHALDEAQSVSALATLKNCEEKARAYADSKAREFERLDQRVKKTESLDAAERRTQTTSVAKDRAKLMKPISDIFERDLKPRLDALLTSAQHKEAAKAKKPPK